MISFDTYTAVLLNTSLEASLFELVQRNSERLAQYFPNTLRENLSFEATKNYIPRKVHEAAQKIGYTAILFDDVTDTPLGLLIIKKIDWEAKTCELAYFIDATYEGKGIISKAIKQLCEYCFNTLQLKTIALRIGEDNPGSLRVAEKNNFVKKHILKDDHADFQGNKMDVIHFELTRD